MPSTVDVLTAAGIQRAAEVVELANTARLDVAAAAVLLLKESGGGRNVWGSDPVPTGNAYTKGGPVTQANYNAYRRAIANGTAKPQGCGPVQITWLPYADQADAAGGCWDWRANVLTGFKILRGLIVAHGEQDGFRRYNGSGPAAEAYGVDAVARLKRIRQQLAGASPPASGPDTLPTLKQGDTGTAVASLQDWSNRFGWKPPLPLLTVDGEYGAATVGVVKAAQAQCGITGPDAIGTPVGPRTKAAFWARGWRG